MNTQEHPLVKLAKLKLGNASMRHEADELEV